MLNAIVRTLLAPICAVCDRPLELPLAHSVCLSCLASWPPLAAERCARCAEPLPAQPECAAFDAQASSTPPLGAERVCARCQAALHAGRAAVVEFRAAGAYDAGLKAMIHAFKYRRRRLLAPVLAARMRESARDLLPHIDAVVPVPLHPLRRWQRGFNQADDLAQRLGPPVWRALRRARSGPPQASLSGAARAANVHGSFELSWYDQWRARRRRARLRGASVLLVDDVVTTSATTEACAAVLRRAGVEGVWVVSAARAAASPPLRSPPAPRLSAVRRQ